MKERNGVRSQTRSPRAAGFSQVFPPLLRAGRIYRAQEGAHESRKKIPRKRALSRWRLFCRCGEHALNNLLGRSWVTPTSLSSTAEKLRSTREVEEGRRSLFNPYHHVLGAWIGDWDVSVIIDCLRQQDMHVKHHLMLNPARPDSLPKDLALVRTEIECGQGVVGVIVNEVSRGLLFKFRHWLSIVPVCRDVDGTAISGSLWQNCDSKLSFPRLVETEPCDRGEEPGSLGSLVGYLEHRARTSEAQIFVVVRETARC